MHVCMNIHYIYMCISISIYIYIYIYMGAALFSPVCFNNIIVVASVSSVLTKQQ